MKARSRPASAPAAGSVKVAGSSGAHGAVGVIGAVGPLGAIGAIGVAAALVGAVSGCGPAPVPEPPPPATTTTAIASAPPPEPPPTATAVASAAPVCKEPEGPRPKVLNAAEWKSSKDWTAWTGDASEPVVKACKKLEKRRATLVKKLKDDAHRVGDVGRCLPSPKGAWVLDTSGDVQPLKAAANQEAGWEVRFTLAYVTPEGKLVRSKKQTHALWKRGIEANDFDVTSVFDHDGDGVSELVLSNDHHYGDEDRTEKRTMYTWKNEEAVPYANAAFVFTDERDVDEDGRPDLVVPGPFLAEGPCGLEGRTYRGPVQIAHALADGKFSTDDAVAKEAVRVQCGPAPAELLVVNRVADVLVEDDPSVGNIACARIYGATVDDVRARLRSEYPLPHAADDSETTNPAPCLTLAELVKLAGQQPPFTMDPPCPAK